MSNPNEPHYELPFPPQGQPIPPGPAPAQPFTPPPPQQPPYYSPQYPPYQPQPMYYQQPVRQSGCGTFAVRFAIGCVILIVCAFVGIALLGVIVGAVSSVSGEIALQEKTLSEKYVNGNKQAQSKIAVIDISGMIVGDDDGFIVKQIRAVTEDNDVQAVVIRVESPGGTMAGSDYYHYLLKKMKTKREIPIVVSMGSIAASGGYYISMIGDKIYAEPSTITGSIGVIVSLYNGSELCKKIGVEPTPITSGQFKAMGSFSKPMSDEERAIWQRLVDDSFGRFKQIIRNGRKEFAANPDELDKLATGQIYTANEALENKLIDEIGFLDNAIDKARELAGLSDRDSKAIRYKPKKNFVEMVLENRAPNNLLQGETLTSVTTPQVYLLCPHVVPSR